MRQTLLDWKKEIVIWWVWTLRPFLLHPIRTVRDWFTWPQWPDIDQSDLEHLTPEERKAIGK